jgi:hypothetical protein
MNRLQANIQLLKILEALIKEQGADLRFSQILQSYGFVRQTRPAKPDLGIEWMNEFYEEPEVILERVKRTTANYRG